MRFEHGNRLINIDSYLGIARKLAPRPAERGKSFLMVADVHVQKSLVELRAFQIEGGQIETRMGGALSSTES